MDQSSAAEALFEVEAGPGPRTRFQSRTRDSRLSTAPPSPAPPTAHRGTRRHVHFDLELETGPSSAPATIPARSTRGKAPGRLVDRQTLPKSTQRRVTAKHPPSTQLQQPLLKKVSASRKPLSNAANTLGKKRTSNTSKKTKIQPLATENRPAKLYNNPAPTTRRSTTTGRRPWTLFNSMLAAA